MVETSHKTGHSEQSLSTADVTFATGVMLLLVLSLAVKLELSLVEGEFSSFKDNF